MELSKISEVKVHGYFPISGEATLIFIFASHLISGQLLKKRICSPRSKFFPLREDPILTGLNCPGKQTGSPKSCFPL